MIILSELAAIRAELLEIRKSLAWIEGRLSPAPYVGTIHVKSAEELRERLDPKLSKEKPQS